MSSKRSEPWFNERLNSITGQDKWTKNDEIISNQIKRQEAKHYFFYQAFEFIIENSIEGDYHEFGCHRCRTFRMALLEASKHFLEKKIKFYAYDSFEGLPKVEEDHEFGSRSNPGALSTSTEEFKTLIIESGYKLDNVQLIKGYYAESLPRISHKEFYLGRKASLINIDCDLYESAIPVFHHINELVQEGTILYIDDYFAGYKGNPLKGVSKALKEWQEVTEWKIERYRDVGFTGRSYIVYK